MQRIRWPVALFTMLLGLFVVAGCGGGGGGGFNPNTTGIVSGTVVDLNGGAGVEGAQVAIGARSAKSGDTGSFTVQGVTPGTQLRVTVTPPATFVLASGEDIRCTVVAGQTTTLASIFVIPESAQPPDPVS